MTLKENKQTSLQNLPGVDTLLVLAGDDRFYDNVPMSVIKNAMRDIIENLRHDILNNQVNDVPETEIIMDQVKKAVNTAMIPNLAPLVNATGVVVHTNLGRSLLADKAMSHIMDIATRYSNLEFDVKKGTRGLRYSLVEDILTEISGAEAAMVVNNNAGAVLLCLDTMARGKEVIVSRGELVEIGGSFRIPDVMAKSGGILKEVGTTNRTHKKDYEQAITNNTGLLLKVHTSNYAVVGFTAHVSLKELVALGKEFHLPVMEDLGSGTFVDFSRFGLHKEPTVQESVDAGIDIVTFSGDKLLGGPQAGIIVGKKDIIENIRKNPLTRALRIDKLTLAALEATFRLFRDQDQAMSAIPTLRMLTQPISHIEKNAIALEKLLNDLNNPRLNICLKNISSKAGGGSLPLLELPSKCLGIEVEGMSANQIEKSMRLNSPPVIGRIEEDIFIMDLRTVRDGDLSIIRDAVQHLLI
ncbi:MAG: L-seryl-tRNA(Sec) selenium transferase [Desulfobacterales bacterium]|nr:L-seryl-tRNA(Sec) selenium transferase [Desulfobacterales bacterium]